MVKVRPISHKNKKDLDKFIKLPWKIYRDYPAWVPPLISQERDRFNPEKNPFYEHAEIQLFLAERDGEVVGRITAHIDFNYNEFHDEKTGFFGFFESINDQEVANALFDTVMDWHSQHGMEQVLGPASFSTNDIVGLLIDAFDLPPVVMMPYNPPYYVNLIENYGFTKIKDLLAYKIDVNDEFKRFAEHFQRRLKPMADRALANGYTIRNINLKNWREETEKILIIYNDAWERNWGFVPWTRNEFMHLGKDLKDVAIPELAKIVEKDGEPVAFGLVVPDVNIVLKKLNGRIIGPGLFAAIPYLIGLKKIKRVRLITLGIRKGYRKSGVDSLLYYNMLKDGIGLGYIEECEVSWLLEDNYLIIRAVQFLKGYHYKTYRLFVKPI